MRVFVTGATGFIGSAVVKELLDAGHQVVGLARSEASADALKAAGADVHYGSLEDTVSLTAGAANSDGVIHTGFIHDFSNYVAACETDRKAIAALAAGLAHSGKPLVVTSGTALLASGNVTTEESIRPADSILPRVSELAAADAAALGVNVAIVRLPPSVHGDGDHGFVPMLIHIAREKNAAVYVGDGGNRWPAVHRLDAARLFRLALEKGDKDAVYHGVAETGVPMREIAGIIGKRLGVPVLSKTPEEAADHFGWIAHFAAIDNPSSSELTRNVLGWKPTHTGLLDDMENGTYF
ncbi:SDR family oxidoreductase [Ferruginibacter sp. HRS2-29]|uniref:SDR family oxidoreductase n=1 Tax=Ferruginibacter sp. HRS2-29 TaxID=2487334 RepID=UPI0020CFBBD5|nr:SDR family oxidoreductase [Ferruginibacter sp. HRS2-29]MCP9750181.1 SDR family oxidoreductase [Ferruginibacter sp. HRS2-29]